MANEEHLKILEHGVEIWNEWRKDNPEIHPDLSEAKLPEANFIQANLKWADLSSAYLVEANLFSSNLMQSNLRKADISKGSLNSANLFQADLQGANLGYAKLIQADLRDTDFRGADLSRADLSGADLYQADMTGADLSLANLKETSLREASLWDADLTAANLTKAELLQANLRGAKFIRTELGGTVFYDAEMGHTIMVDIDLRQVQGLDRIKHYGPSFIGVDTIYRSKGKIPEIFLRHAGLPDIFVEYIPSLIGEAIQFYSCFISYSTKDQEFAERLNADLQSKGVRCWFAPEDIKGGRKLHEQIPEAIRLYDKLLLVLSENSMKSEWVKSEIYHARQDEIRNIKRKLFPIGLVDFGAIRNWEAFDADSGKDMAREIREYFIPDFSNWKDHDTYKKAFERLLHDLEAEGLDQLQA